MTEELKPAIIHWKNSKTPVSDDYNDVYFSADDGMAESDFVFLQNNHLAQRFENLNNDADTPHEKAFVIGETGFGSGLNFCNCWHLWRQKNRSGRKLTFISAECHPLTPADLQKTLNQWPTLEQEAKALIANYPPLIKGIHQIELGDDVSLILIFDEVVEGFSKLLELPNINYPLKRTQCIDAWFLDGFAPSKNPDMWRPEVFQRMARLSNRHTTLATFTAAGIVKRGLQNVGFRVSKVKGFGRKRDMIQARFAGLPEATPPLKSASIDHKKSAFWPIYPTNKKPKTVAIIGAGIAGFCSALTLAKAGFRVTLIDKAKAPLMEASGNPQAVIFPKFSHAAGSLSDFYLYAYFYALRYFDQHFPGAFHRTGMLQLIPNDNPKALSNAKMLSQRYQQQGIAQWVDPETATQLAGTTINTYALYHANAGWVEQDRIRSALQQETSINHQYNTDVTRLDFINHQWQITTSTQKFNADALILANANQAEPMLASIDDGVSLGTRPIRGQITQIPKDNLPTINTIICHEGYLCPLAPDKAWYGLGATYDLNNSNPVLCEISQKENLQRLAQAVDGLSSINDQSFPLAGKVGFRCTTRDYLPIVGPVPDSTNFRETYQALQHNKHAFIPEIGRYHPQLYMNTGLGSRGFTSAPINAAILTSYLTGEVFPIDVKIVKSLHPARFLIRDIIKNRTM